MDKKINVCKTIRYSIIEITPTFLKHEIPLIQIFNYTVYWGSSIYFFIKNTLHSLFSGISNFYEYWASFFKKKNVSKQKGADIAFEAFTLNKIKLKNPLIMNIDEISLLPAYLIYKKEIIFFYKEQAIEKLKEVKQTYNLKIPDFDPKNIVLKKETFYISKEASQLCNKITVSISYNQAAIFSLKVLKHLKIIK